MFPEYDDLPDTTLADGLHGRFFNDMAKDLFLSTLGIASQQAPAPFGIREGEWGAANKRMQPQAGPALPEIPPMHQGKMLNLDGRQWSDGRAQSLDFYLQPSMNLKQGKVGINGAGLIYRKTW